jgi:predicted GNAT family N-acyltransferase
MLALQREAQRRGYSGITVAAQLQAIPFYERLGYRAYGEVFLDARIEHRLMDLSL